MKFKDVLEVINYRTDVSFIDLNRTVRHDGQDEQF